MLYRHSTGLDSDSNPVDQNDSHSPAAALLTALRVRRSLLSQPTGPADDLEGLGYTLLEVGSAGSVLSSMQ